MVRLLFFLQELLLQRKMGRIVRKKEVLTDTPAQFELGETTADIQSRKEERE